MIDQEIAKAIQHAVKAQGQPPSVAEKLIAWFGAVVAESEDVQDIDKAEARLDMIFKDITLSRRDF